ncbi:asparagine--tRNA ligase [endosymbiont of Pachyrhynchus infernalis]|uniref:asparagine--tRNA ligase n=1 Tax=endosymbiont of Pachyrhynchus infernalis TaxID=1971488 RepID=UPI000DC6EE81|nr:asparagine--tRNA ligase [endosymbiont of Pachyrhynchus infernalis]BBA84885.1 asparagine--tRNA ligase [endosymbiont of Pachyrhynchus infernalis]
MFIINNKILKKMKNSISILYLLKNIDKFLNKIVSINGWVRNKRTSNIGITFISIYDGSSFNDIQIISNNNLKNYKEITNITTGYSLNVIGLLIKSIGKFQSYEIKATEINIIGKINDPKSYPISKKKHSLEFLRKVEHLRIRTKLFSSISRIRSFVFNSINNFMNKNNFIWVPTSIITCYNTEGNNQLFEVHLKDDLKKKFFGKDTFLTVSGQLNLESYACGLSKVYTFGPAFRAENSNTRKHLSEFWMLEVEIAFNNLDDIILLSELLIKNVYNLLLDNYIDDIVFIHRKNNLKIDYLNNIINNNFNILDYSDAIKIINKSKFNNIKWGLDISSDNEKYLLDYFNNIPVVIKNFPKNIKPFYMKVNNDEITVSSMDILLPNVGEVIGGSEREDNYEILNERLMNCFGDDLSNYQWYSDLRKYGSVPHSGFGLGFERLLLSITGMNNIRDISPFPKTPNNINS